jgi:hypothetical protein
MKNKSLFIAISELYLTKSQHLYIHTGWQLKYKYFGEIRELRRLNNLFRCTNRNNFICFWIKIQCWPQSAYVNKLSNLTIQLPLNSQKI